MEYKLFRAINVFFCMAVPLALLSCTHSEKKGFSSMENRNSQFELIKSDYKAGEVTRICEEKIQEADRKLNDIAHLSSPKRNLSNTLLAFETILADLGDATSKLTFMGYVSTDSAINSEGSSCAQKLGDFMVKVFTRRDLYDAVKSPTTGNPDEHRLQSETLKAFEKNGLKLSDEKLAKVRQWMQELNQKEVEFAKNLAQDTSSVKCTLDELIGASSHFLDRLEKTPDGKFIVTTKSTDYTHVMENVSNSETRRKVQFAYMNRSAARNTQLLEEAIHLRQKIAEALGFSNWADYQTQDRMALNSGNVLNFLNSIKSQLSKRNKQDLNKLMKLKKEMEPGSKDMKQWDIPYYAYQLKKRDYSLDDEKVREYFPAETVISGMFNVYSKLLGVEFVEVKNAKTWADGVKLYEIRELNQSIYTNPIAYFYTDFWPRPLKYGHAAAFSLISGRKNKDGSYSKPVSAIVANMNPPAKNLPSLLNHVEVVTLFHEFGHIMHQTLTRAPFASLSGSSVARDFVEAPSQMLENWVWSPEILSAVSGHYQDPTRKLPADLLKKLIAARDFNQGYFYNRQLYFGFMDMTYHTTTHSVAVTDVSNRLFKDMFNIDPIEGGHFPATFGHLMGGYDAGYYGYLWSEVYAADMFSRFKRSGVLNSKLGMKYRKEILERGNMAPAVDLLKGFLEREPSQEAFFKKLHIRKESKSKSF